MPALSEIGTCIFTFPIFESAIVKWDMATFLLWTLRDSPAKCCCLALLVGTCWPGDMCGDVAQRKRSRIACQGGVREMVHDQIS